MRYERIEQLRGEPRDKILRIVTGLLTDKASPAVASAYRAAASVSNYSQFCRVTEIMASSYGVLEGGYGDLTAAHEEDFFDELP